MGKKYTLKEFEQKFGRNRTASPVESFQRGVVQSPSHVVEILNNMIQAANPGTNTVSLGEDFIESSKQAADRIAPAPISKSGRYLETAGKQTVPAVGGAILGGAGGGIPSAVGEGALAYATPVIGEALRDAGFSEGQALTGEMLTAILAPSVGARAMGRSAAHRLSAEKGLRDAVLRDESGSGRFFDEATSDIVASQEGLANPWESATLDVVMSDTAPGIENIAIRKAQGTSRRDKQFASRMGGRKRIVENVQRQRMERMTGGPGDFGSLRGARQAQEEAAREANQQLWNQLDLDGQNPATTRHLQKAMDKSESKAGTANADTLPVKQFDQLREFGDTIPWSELQNYRSRFGAIIREGTGPGTTAVQELRIGHARRMMDAIDETIENAPSHIKESYPEAIASHRRWREDFDKGTKAYRAFDTQDNPRLFAAELLDGKQAITEARSARTMLGNDSEALNNLKHTLIQDTILPDYGNFSAKGLKNRYNKRRMALAEILPEEELVALDSIMSRGAAEGGGKAGTRGQNYAPGSATPRDIAQGNWMKWIKDNLGHYITGNDMLKNRVMEDFIMNPSEALAVIEAGERGGRGALTRAINAQVGKTMARAAGYTGLPEHISEE